MSFLQMKNLFCISVELQFNDPGLHLHVTSNCHFRLKDITLMSSFQFHSKIQSVQSLQMKLGTANMPDHMIFLQCCC
jgi:hypothetical protein